MFPTVGANHVRCVRYLPPFTWKTMRHWGEYDQMGNPSVLCGAAFEPWKDSWFIDVGIFRRYSKLSCPLCAVLTTLVPENEM